MEGNQQKMREALLEIETVAEEAVENGTMELPQYSKMVDIAESALAAPLRNCDVGTAEEQAQRFERFCAAHHEEWKNGRPLMAWTCDCPCYQIGKNSCNYFTWAQMPYDAEAEGAK